MSTANIRAVIEHYRRLTGDTRIKREANVGAALDEVGAITRAAKALARFAVDPPRTDSERALLLLESIAKEAP